MKNLMKSLAAMSVVAAVVAGVAVARPHSSKVTDAQVQAAIDARLHEMLVKLNAQHGQ